MNFIYLLLCFSSFLFSIEGFDYVGYFNGSSYYLSHEPADWYVAKEHCQSNGGHLVTISNQEENNYVADINPDCQSCNATQDRAVWIGAHRDFNNPDNFHWITGEVWDYDNWQPDEPNPAYDIHER